MKMLMGESNRHSQKLIDISVVPGNHRALPYATILECQKCGHQYVANLVNMHNRKCPKCQGGKPSSEIARG